MDKRMRRAKVNALSSLLTQLVSVTVGIVTPWIMIGYFGSEAYGITTSISQFLAYIALFEGGIGRLARGALYGPLAAGDDEQVSSIYMAIKRFFAIVGVAFVGYTLVLAVFYYDIADVTIFDRAYIFVLVLAIALHKFAEYMWGISNITLLNAHQRQYVVNGVTMLSNILNLIAIVLLVSFGSDVLLVKLVSSIVFLIKPLIYTIYVKRCYTIKKSSIRAVLKNKATGIAQHMAYVVQDSTDVLILTICSDLKFVAVYSVYHLITFNLRNIVTAFTGGMEAVFGDMIAKHERKELKATYEKYKLILTVLVVALFGTAAVLIVPFVNLYTAGTTDVEYTQPMFAFLMVLVGAINCIIWPCFNLTIAANMLKESRLGSYGEVAINLIVSFLLVFWNPLIGIAIGTLASVLYKAVFYIIFSGRKILQTKPLKILRNTLIVVVVLIFISIAGEMILRDISLYNYTRWIAAGFVTLPITAAIGLIIGLCLYPHIVKNIVNHMFKQKRSNA